VLLAGDDPGDLQCLKALVEALRPNWVVVAMLDDIDAVPAAIESLSPSLCVLDIRFAETTGIEVMRQLHTSHPVIYVTGDASFAVRAFDLSAIDFIMKPVRPERFEQALQRAERAFAVQEKKPVGVNSTGSTMVRMLRGADLTIVRLDQVRYFQAESKYTRVVLHNQEGYLRMGLSAIEPFINQEQFWRINRGYIINARHVTLAKRDELGRLFVRLQDRAESLPVARPYESLFRDGFS
jgi:DNA-binding LytR/AlgR family response regulator